MKPWQRGRRSDPTPTDNKQATPFTGPYLHGYAVHIRDNPPSKQYMERRGES